LLEQKGQHSYIPQRASLQPQARPGARTAERNYPYPPQYQVRTPPTNRPVADDLEVEEDENYYPVRSSSSAIRYTTTQGEEVIQRGNKRIIIHHEPPPGRQPPPQQLQPEPVTKSRKHWLFFVGIVMLLMLVGWVLVTMLLQWWSVTQDDWHYGRPRTFQIDQRVGHGDTALPSHFVAMNLNHRVQIIECPAGDCTKAIVYVGAQLIGDGQDLAVVTLTFKDVNGDGKLDMLVHVADQTYVFLNDKGRFRPARPDEHITM